MFVYIAQVPSGAVKVGRTDKMRVESRVNDLRFNGERARLVAARKMSRLGAIRAEYNLHHGPIANSRISGEWYRPSWDVQRVALEFGGRIEMPKADSYPFSGEGI